MAFADYWGCILKGMAMSDEYLRKRPRTREMVSVQWWGGVGVSVMRWGGGRRLGSAC